MNRMMNKAEESIIKKLCGHTKTMGDKYTAVPLLEVNPAIVVHFYGASSSPFHVVPLSISASELPLTCEEIIIRSAIHLSDNRKKFFPEDNERDIGPQLVTLFGLFTKKSEFSYWVPEGNIFKDDGVNAASKEFVFRIKVRPAKKKKGDKQHNKIPEGIFLDYFFWQCSDDFNSGRIWTLFNTANDVKIKSVDSINKNILHILIGTACYKMHDVAVANKADILQKPLNELTNIEWLREKVTLRKVHTFMPCSLPEDVQKEYDIGKVSVMRLLAYTKLRRYIKEFYEKMGKENLKRIRAAFVEQFLNSYVPSYGLQYFPAEKVHSARGVPLPVDLVIRPHQEGCPAGLYFNRVFKAHLKDIYKAEILSEECTDAKVQFTLFMGDQSPMFLQMESQEMVASFLSVLMTYCRLKINYYETLELDLDDNSVVHVPPGLLTLRSLHSFGPMTHKDALEVLKQARQEPRLQRRPLYLLHHDPEHFGLMYIVQLEINDTERPKIFPLHYTLSADGCKSGFSSCVLFPGEGENVTFKTATELFHYINGLGLGARVTPKDVPAMEKCGAMKIMDDELNAAQYYEGYNDLDTHYRRRRPVEESDDQPRIFLEDDLSLTLDKCISHGEFSDVYRLELNKRDVIVKKITQDNLSEAYRKGQSHLMRLHEICPRSFVRVLGATLTSPLHVVFESMPRGQGSLLARLKDGNKRPLTWKQVGSIMWELADCLARLKGQAFYGNLRCAKIMIWQETEEFMRIKLGDPSAAMYFDRLGLNDAQNMKRLPWIAPERFENLSRHTPETEIYAFGTVVWEILYSGADPNAAIPGDKKPLDFFKSGQYLPDPTFSAVLNAMGEIMRPTPLMERVGNWVQNIDPDAAIDEYAKVGETEHSGDTVFTLLTDSGEGNQENGLRSPMSVSDKAVQDIQNIAKDVMHQCWNRDPKMRPECQMLQRIAVNITSSADKLARRDPLHSTKLFVNCIIDQNVLNDSDKKKLQELCSQTEEGNAHGKGREAILKQLQDKLREVTSTFLMNDMLEPPLESRTILGEGNYGKVVKAELKPLYESASAERAAGGTASTTTVAVKLLKEQVQSQVILFLNEAINICRLQHENIVRTIGIVLAENNNPYQLVMEYADQGSLEKYSSKTKPKIGTLATKKELVQYLVQTARGMKYISLEHKMIHGDLAARNVLLFSKDGKGSRPFTAKLSDFGLSHKMKKGQHGSYYYDSTNSANENPTLPVFWMPLEVLDNFGPEAKFNTKVDVWSFGVTMWEVFSGGICPSKQLTDASNRLEGMDLVRDLRHRYRHDQHLKKTDHCPKAMYDIMKECWDHNPQSRPDFDRLCLKLEQLSERELEQ